MSNGMTNPGSGATYELEPKNKYFEAIRAIAEYEIRPGNTVTFLSEVDLTEVERVRAARPGDEGRPTRRSSSRPWPWPCASSPTRTGVCAGGPGSPSRDRACRSSITATWPSPASATSRAPNRSHFVDILRDADRLSLTEITAALHDLAVCDPSTNKQWREFSTLDRSAAVLALHSADPLALPGPQALEQVPGWGGPGQLPGQVWRRRRRRDMDASAGRLIRDRQDSAPSSAARRSWHVPRSRSRSTSTAA